MQKNESKTKQKLTHISLRNRLRFSINKTVKLFQFFKKIHGFIWFVGYSYHCHFLYLTCRDYFEMNSSTNMQNFLTKYRLLLGFVLSNYETTLAFFCKTVTTGFTSLYPPLKLYALFTFQCQNEAS